MSDAGGWLWVVIDVVMVAVLAGALIYAMQQWRHRRTDRKALRARDAATREVFNEPDR